MLVESSVVNNHASDACPLDQARKSNKEGDLLETCSADSADDVNNGMTCKGWDHARIAVSWIQARGDAGN